MTSLAEWLFGGRAPARGTRGRNGSFVLLYAPYGGTEVTVGHLGFDGSTWTFRYDDDFKRHSELRPIEGFVDLDRTYESSVLFPFFRVRIPDIQRPDIAQELKKRKTRTPNVQQIDLLEMFGERVAASPSYRLVSNNA